MTGAVFLSVSQVAALAGIPERTIRYWCQRGALPSRRGIVRGRYLIPAWAVARAFETGAAGAES